MPTYEYVCTDCASPLEVVQSIHEPSLTDCPACDGGRLRKVYGNVGVVFKGSGFYRTDSRGKPATGSAGGTGSGTGTKGATSGNAGAGDSATSTPSGTSKAAGTSQPSGTSKAPAAPVPAAS